MHAEAMKRHLTCIVFLAALVAAAPAAGRRDGRGHGRARLHELDPEHPVDPRQADADADAYRLRARYYRDNVQVSEVTWSRGMGGTAWLNWSGVAPLRSPGRRPGR